METGKTAILMPRRTLPPLLLAAALAAAPPAAAAETLSGLVVPPAAAARARVELWPACPPASAAGRPAPQPLAVVRPGPDGRFQIDAPAGEPVRLRVEADGFVPAERPAGPGDAELPPLRLRRAEALEVALADPDGSPLAGILLFVLPVPDGGAAPVDDRGWDVPEARAVTDADGRAHFRRRPGAAVTLIVADRRRLGVHTLAAGSPQRLVLPPGRSVTLTVTNPQGRPVAGARVRLGTWGVGRGRRSPAPVPTAGWSSAPRPARRSSCWRSTTAPAATPRSCSAPAPPPPFPVPGGP